MLVACTTRIGTSVEAKRRWILATRGRSLKERVTAIQGWILGGEDETMLIQVNQGGTVLYVETYTLEVLTP